MEVVVTGIGLATALGSLEMTWSSLLSGKSALSLRQPFPGLLPMPLAMIDKFPLDLEGLTGKVVSDALEDAKLESPLSDCGVVVGSSRANQGLWEKLVTERWQTEQGREWNTSENPQSKSSLSQWFNTLPHAAAIVTAQYIQTTASVLAPMAACATGIWAIAQGYELIRTGQCERVLAGAIEAPITPLTLTGFERMGALAKTGAYPFDCSREGLVLGEGGAILVLESAELAKKRRAKVYGRILGFGLTADGYHVSAPEPGSQSAIAAIKRCLERSQLSPSDIDYVHAHGTATRLNDLNEAHLLQSLFPTGVPVSSTKGATGHTIGASGALGAAFCLMALNNQIFPPCVGLSQPDFDLDFVKTAQTGVINHTLCLSFGFGGQNGAIALGR